MATLIRASSRHSVSFVVVTAAALILSACSSGSRVESPDGSDATPSRATSTTPRRNGGLAFSRAAPPSVDGSLFDAVLREVDADGGVGPMLVRGATYRTALSWAPDGASFAFLGPHGISVRRAHSSRLVVPCHPSACSGLGPPSWSPDGSTIAFAGDLAGDEGVFGVSPEGGPPSPIATDLAVLGTPAWSPAGDQLAVIASAGQARSLQILDADSGNVERTTDLPGMRLGASVAWSPAGDRLALDVVGSGQGDHQGIYLVALDGSAAQALTVCPDAGCVDLAPSFSPDGRWVAFTRARCDEPGSDCFVGDVWVVGVDGADAHALTDGPELDCCAAWRSLPS
jgi:Tol biopolymer transport system component